jgi:hypothetical protein
MQTDSWIESFRAGQTQAVKLLGARNVSLCLNEGKVYNTPGWSGLYLAELAASADGCTALLSFLDSLERGDAVPIALMDRHVPTDVSMLQLIDGQLYEVWPEGKRLPVDGYRH